MIVLYCILWLTPLSPFLYPACALCCVSYSRLIFRRRFSLSSLPFSVGLFSLSLLVLLCLSVSLSRFVCLCLLTLPLCVVSLSTSSPLSLSPSSAPSPAASCLVLSCLLSLVRLLASVFVSCLAAGVDAVWVVRLIYAKTNNSTRARGEGVSWRDFSGGPGGCRRGTS